MLFVCRLGEKSTRAEKTSTRMEQSEEGGDFLSVFLKKYYLFLVKVLALKEKEKNLDGESLQEGLVLVFNLIAPSVSYDSQVKTRVVNKDFVPFLNEVFSERLEVWLDRRLLR